MRQTYQIYERRFPRWSLHEKGKEVVKLRLFFQTEKSRGRKGMAVGPFVKRKSTNSGPLLNVIVSGRGGPNGGTSRDREMDTLKIQILSVPSTHTENSRPRRKNIFHSVAYVYWVWSVLGFCTRTTINTCWKWDRMVFGEKGRAPASWNTIVTMSFPMWRFRNN